jgi:hypothetical protein
MNENAMDKDACSVFLWEILVPTIRKTGKPYRTRFHRLWDAKVRSLSGGLTITEPTKGQWISPEGKLVAERMIPVRFMATRAQANEIIDFTLKYYEQDCVMCYRLSDEVILRYATKRK